MSVKLASLFFEISARGNGLTAELVKSEKRTQAWSKRVSRSANAATLAFKGTAAAVAGYATSLALIYANDAANIAAQDKIADRLGTTVGQLKLLGEVGKSAGVDIDGVNDTLADFVERLGEARIDGGEPAEALDLLGLSAERLAQQDPAVALREVLAAMEQLPDAGVRAATGAKLFGDEGIRLTGILSEEFVKAEEKIEALGGAISDLEVDQIRAAQSAVSDIRLAADLATDRFTAKLAPAVEVVAKQLFEAAKQTGSWEQQTDRLIVGSLRGLATFSGAVGDLLGFLNGREEIVQYGVIGRVLFGKKAALVGGLLGAVSDTIETNLNAIRGFFGDAADEQLALERKLQSLETELRNSAENLSFLGESFGGFVNDLFYDDQESVRAEIEATRARLEELGSDAGQATGFVDALTASFKGLETGLLTAAEEYGNLPDTLEPPTSRDRSGAPPAGPEPFDAEAFAANQAEFGTEITAYQQYQDSRVEAMERASEIEADIRQRDFEAQSANNRALIDQYTVLQESRVESAAEAARQASLSEFEVQRLALDDYFAYRSANEEQFQNTWTAFQGAGAKDRLQILLKETSGALATLASHSKAFFRINQLAGLANATVSIATGVSKALELPFPANLAAAATVALEGLAQITTITQAKFGKGEVSTPGAGGSAGASGGGVIPQSQTSIGGGLAATAPLEPGAAGAGGYVAVFTSPGATEEQRIEETAQAVAIAVDNDILSPAAGGRFRYNGSGPLSYVKPAWTAA
jgi:hypothetical protein